MYTQENSKTYTGTKALRAWPATRGEYNAYRGWSIPADEDAHERGYLVEYIDVGKANHPNHAGYISWSSSYAFENAYVEDIPQDWRTRLFAEGVDAASRLVKLDDFIASPGFNGLDPVDQELLALEAQCLTTYVDILARRAGRALLDSNMPNNDTVS